MQYQNYSCNQLAQEANRVLAARAAQVAGTQDKNASNDAVATGVALVVFWQEFLHRRQQRDESGTLQAQGRVGSHRISHHPAELQDNFREIESCRVRARTDRSPLDFRCVSPLPTRPRDRRTDCLSCKTVMV